MSGSLAFRCTAYLPKLVHMTDKSIAQSEADGVLKHDHKPKHQIEEAAGAACDKQQTPTDKTCSPAEVWAQISAATFHKGAVATPDKSESTVKLPGLEFEHPRLELKSFVALLTETFKSGSAHSWRSGTGHFEKVFEHLAASSADRQLVSDRNAVPSHSNWLREAVEKKLVEKANPFSSIVQVGLRDEGSTGIKSKVNIFEPISPGKIDTAVGGEKATLVAPVNPFHTLNRVALKEDQNAETQEAKSAAPPVVKASLTTGEGDAHSLTRTVSPVVAESGLSAQGTVNLPVSSQKHTIDRSDSLVEQNHGLPVPSQIPTIFFSQLVVKDPEGSRKILTEPVATLASAVENQGVVGNSSLKVETVKLTGATHEFGTPAGQAPVVAKLEPLHQKVLPEIGNPFAAVTHLVLREDGITDSAGRKQLFESLGQTLAMAPLVNAAPPVVEVTASPTSAATKFQGDTNLPVNQVQSGKELVAITRSESQASPIQFQLPTVFFGQLIVKEPETIRSTTAEPMLAQSGGLSKPTGLPERSGAAGNQVVESIKGNIRPEASTVAGSETTVGTKVDPAAMKVAGVEYPNPFAAVTRVALIRPDEQSLPVHYQIPSILFSQLLVKSPDSLTGTAAVPVFDAGSGTNTVQRTTVVAASQPLNVETAKNQRGSEVAASGAVEVQSAAKSEPVPVKVTGNMTGLVGNPFAAVTQVVLKEDTIVDIAGRKVVFEPLGQGLAVGPLLKSSQSVGEVTASSLTTAANPSKVAETTMPANPTIVARENVNASRLEGQVAPAQNQIPTIAFNQLVVKEPEVARKLTPEAVLSQNNGYVTVNRVVENQPAAGNSPTPVETAKPVDASKSHQPLSGDLAVSARVEPALQVKAPVLESNANPFRALTQLVLREDSIADGTGKKIVLEPLPQAQAVALQGQTVYKAPLPLNDGSANVGAPPSVSLQLAGRTNSDGNVSAPPITISTRTGQESDLSTRGLPVHYQVPTVIAAQLLVKDPELQLRRTSQETGAAVSVVSTGENLRAQGGNSQGTVQVVAVNTVSTRIEPSLSGSQAAVPTQSSGSEVVASEKFEPSAVKVQAAVVNANPFQSVTQVALRDDAVVDMSGKKLLAEPISQSVYASTLPAAKNPTGGSDNNSAAPVVAVRTLNNSEAGPLPQPSGKTSGEPVVVPVLAVNTGGTLRTAENHNGAKTENTAQPLPIQSLSQPAPPTVLASQLLVKEPEPLARKTAVEPASLVGNTGEQQISLANQTPQTFVAQRNEQPLSGSRSGADTKVVALQENPALDRNEPPVVAKTGVVPVHNNPFQAVMQVALKEDAIVDNGGRKIVVEPLASSTLAASVPVAARTALTSTETVTAAPVTRNLVGGTEVAGGQNVAVNVAVAGNSTVSRVTESSTVTKSENAGNVGNASFSPPVPTILASQLLVKEPEPTARKNTVEPVPVLTAVTETQSGRNGQAQTLPVGGNRIDPVIVAGRSEPTAEKVEAPVLAKAPLQPANTNVNPFLALTQVALREDGIVDNSGKKVVSESLPQPVYGPAAVRSPVVSSGDTVAPTTLASTTVSSAKGAGEASNQAVGAASGSRAVETVSNGKVESNPAVLREQQQPTILASQLVVREPEPLQRKNYVESSSPATNSAESQSSRNVVQPLAVVSSNRVEPLPIANREPSLPDKIEPLPAKAPVVQSNPFQALTQVALKEDGIVDNSGKKVVAETLPQSASGATLVRTSLVTSGDGVAATPVGATSLSPTRSAGEVTNPAAITSSVLRAVEIVNSGKVENNSTVIREQQPPTILASQLVVKDPEQSPRKNYVDSSQLLANSGDPQNPRNPGQPLTVAGANRAEPQPSTTRFESTLPEKSEPVLAKAPVVQNNPFQSVTQVALREDGIADAGGKKIAFEPLTYTSIAPVLARSVLSANDSSTAAALPKSSTETSTVAGVTRSGADAGVSRVENAVPAPLLAKEPQAVALPNSPKALTPGLASTNQLGAKELAADTNLPVSVPSAISAGSKAVSLANQLVLVGKEVPTGKGEAVVGVETVGAKVVAGLTGIAAGAGNATIPVGIGTAAGGSEGAAAVSKSDGVGSGKQDLTTSTATKGEGTLTAKSDALTTIKGDGLGTAKSDALTTAKSDPTGAVKSEGLTGKTVKVSETANAGNGRGLPDGTEKTTTGADKGSLLPAGKGTTVIGVQTGEMATGSVLVAGNGTGTTPSAKTKGEAVTPLKPEGSTVLVPLDTKIPAKVNIGGKETESNVSLDLTPAKTGFGGAGGGSSQTNSGTVATNADPAGTTGGAAGGAGVAVGAGGGQAANVDPTLVSAASQPVGPGVKAPFDMSLPPLEIVDAEAEAKLGNSRADTINGSNKGFGSDDGAAPDAAPSSGIDLKTGRGKPEPSGETKPGRREEKGPRAEDLTAAFQVLAEKRRSERRRKPQKKLAPVRKPKEESGYKPEKKRRCFILKGDTLESLAAQYLGDSDLASLIYEINAGFWWEKRRGGKIYLEFIPGTTIFLPTAEEISNFRRKTGSGKVLHQFEYLTPERIRSLRQALKGEKAGVVGTGSKSLTGSESGSEAALALEVEQNEQTTLVSEPLSAAGEVKQAVESKKAVAYTASLKPYEGQSGEEGTRKLLLGGGQASIARLLSGCISEEALEAGSRISLDAAGGQRESFSVARMEVLKDGLWLPVLEYLVAQDSLLKVYSLGGGERVIHLDLPPAVVRGMALNDLNSNRLEYCRKFLLGRKLFC